VRVNRSATAGRWKVLIVDPSEESREVFRTILARRGLSTIEASCMDDGLEMARKHRPSVVVVDVDDHGKDDYSACAKYEQQCREQHTSLVVLGEVGAMRGLDEAEVVSKPYHYGPLIRKIEQLCRQSLASSRSSTDTRSVES